MIVGAATLRERGLARWFDNRLADRRCYKSRVPQHVVGTEAHLAPGAAAPKIGEPTGWRLAAACWQKGGTMKGPGMRLDLDVRRVWECPECHRQMRSEGNATSRICGCTREGVAMRLVELPRPKPQVRVPDPATAESEETQLADFPTDIPVHPPVKRAPPVPDNPDFPAVNWNREPAQDQEPPAEPAE